ncbi:MAG: hypothetical protein V3V12_00215 [Gammaproteobacteria bacterium]
MFKFEDITSSNNGGNIIAACKIQSDAHFFTGHFENFPVMPAVAQLLMIQALIKTSRICNEKIAATKSCKFYQLIQPDQSVQITLSKINNDTLTFMIENGDDVFTKGAFQLTGNPATP